MHKATASVGIAAVLALLSSGCGTDQRATIATPTTAATTTTESVPETFPDEEITTTTKPEVAVGKLGDVANLVNADTGEPTADVAVTRVKFSRGDEFNRPERGYFLGVYVKVRAKTDDVSSMWGRFLRDDA